MILKINETSLLNTEFYIYSLIYQIKINMGRVDIGVALPFFKL